MKIELGTEPTDIGSPLPEAPFLARHLSIHGPLCVVAPNVSIGAGAHFNVLFLEGHGGPAHGDVWSALKLAKIQKEFIPLRTAVVFTNTWR